MAWEVRSMEEEAEEAEEGSSDHRVEIGVSTSAASRRRMMGGVRMWWGV